MSSEHENDPAQGGLGQDPRAVRDGGLVLGEVVRRLFDRVDDQVARLERYVPTGRLGSGGFGVVFEARDPELQRSVAVKLVRMGHDASALALLDEARVLARVSHPNVVAVYDVGRYELNAAQRRGAFSDSPRKGVFVVMELVRGPTLQQWLRDEPRTWRDVVDIFLQAGRGLSAAHDEGIAHRDFKPSNVLIGVDGRARVGDFGLAGPSDSGAESSSDPDAAPAAGAEVVGTPLYMAPEVETGAHADAAADQYSFCVALYEALAGRRPFRGTRLAMAKAKHAGAFAALPGVVPGWLRAAVVRGLAPEPGRRFPTMRALLDAMDWRRRQRRRRVRGGLVGGAVAAAFAFSIGAMRGTQGHCDDVEDALAELWGDARRARVEAAYRRSAATVGVDADAGWTQLQATIGAQRDALLEARRQSCVVPDSSDAPTEGGPLAGAADECYAHRQRELDALLDVFEAGGDHVGRDANDALESSPDAAWCASPKRRRAFPNPPAAPFANLYARAWLALTAATRAARDGDLDLAFVLQDEVIALGTAAQVDSLVAEALVKRASVVMDRGDPVGARALADQALRTSLRAGALGVALDAHAQQIRWTEDPAQAASIVADAEGIVDGLDLRGTRREQSWLNTKASAEHAAGQYAAALVTNARSAELARALFGPRSTAVAVAHINRGVYLLALGREAESVVELEIGLQLYREVVGPDHPREGATLRNLSVAYRTMGRLQEARSYADAALALARRTGGDGSVHVAWAYGNLCTIARDQHQLIAARRACEQALAVRRSALPAEDPAVLRTRALLAQVLLLQGDMAAAAEALDDLVPAHQRTFGPQSQATAVPLRWRAVLRAATGDWEGARGDIAAAARLADSPDNDSSVLRAMTALERATLALDAADFRDAVTIAQAVRADAATATQGEYGFSEWSYAIEGEARWQLGEHDEALRALESAVARSPGEKVLRWQQRARFGLGRALVETGQDAPRGFALVDGVLSELRAQAPDAPLTRFIGDWAVWHPSPSVEKPSSVAETPG